MLRYTFVSCFDVKKASKDNDDLCNITNKVNAINIDPSMNNLENKHLFKSLKTAKMYPKIGNKTKPHQMSKNSCHTDCIF